jgi:hypothetical protein
VLSRRKFAQKQAEPRHHKTKSHQGKTRPDPCEEGPFRRELDARVILIDSRHLARVPGSLGLFGN